MPRILRPGHPLTSSQSFCKVRAALGRGEEEILRDHVAHCVEHAIKSGNAAEQRRKVAELMDVLARSQR